MKFWWIILFFYKSQLLQQCYCSCNHWRLFCHCFQIHFQSNLQASNPLSHKLFLSAFFQYNITDIVFSYVFVKFLINQHQIRTSPLYKMHKSTMILFIKNYYISLLFYKYIAYFLQKDYNAIVLWDVYIVLFFTSITHYVILFSIRYAVIFQQLILHTN